jgi:hypothetical protein
MNSFMPQTTLLTREITPKLLKYPLLGYILGSRNGGTSNVPTAYDAVVVAQW